jgi:predicted dehydrogenase/threonine dehydrogenase-like Zn-dependent dehydrogenase
MKQILQSFKTGNTELKEVPAPLVRRGTVLIQTTHSLVSLGTEKMLVEFGKANLIEKARQQPDKVKMVLDKMKSEGILPTLEAVFNKLEQPLPLGYCNVGKVVEIGEGVDEFQIGDRVVSNGQHAEYVCIPKNLVAKIPSNVSDEEATFTVISSIGLQGIRLAKPTLGETFVVIGLGLIGLLTTQLLKANGCRVIGVDIDSDKCELAGSWGVETINPLQGDEVVKSILQKTNQIGADAVLITASSKSNDIVSQAAQMSRKRGRIILVGVVGLNLSRTEFYEKELTFQVSCSYGPGRYDDDYEQKGTDYPIGFVRWTEKRNFEAILNALSTQQLTVSAMITERVALDEYFKIYDNLGDKGSIASLLIYPEKEDGKKIIRSVELSNKNFSKQRGVIGIIGAGNFTKMTMLPILKAVQAQMKYIASSGGVNGTVLAEKYGISKSTTDYHDLLTDDEVDSIIVTTRHNSHAHQVVDALKANKHVFVEKPLALNDIELNEIVSALQKSDKTLMVGFNRRFSPHIEKIKNSMGSNSGAINFTATMNAGYIPSNSWVHDLEIGGGRIIGEACHLMDLAVFLSNSLITAVCMNALGSNTLENTDNASIMMKMTDGSNATIHYFANGSKSYSKERIEVYSNERTWVIDNFKTTKAYGVKGFSSFKSKLDKGHKNQFQAYLKRLKLGGESLIPIEQLVNVTRASFAAVKSLKDNCWVEV